LRSESFSIGHVFENVFCTSGLFCASLHTPILFIPSQKSEELIMSKENKPDQDKQGASPLREMTLNDRRVSIREDANTFELRINGFPLKVSRMDDGTYHSSILTHQSFDSAEELARALAEIEGKLWVAGPGETGGHMSHKPQTPHDPHDPQDPQGHHD
jgi:hypothetical protein